MKNHYETLNISPSASPEQIKTAYTNTVLKLQGQPNFAAHFTEVQEAYDILANPVTRKQFDIELLNFYTGKFSNHSSTATASATKSRSKTVNRPSQTPKPDLPNLSSISERLRRFAYRISKLDEFETVKKVIVGTLIFCAGFYVLLFLLDKGGSKKSDELPSTIQTNRDIATEEFSKNSPATQPDLQAGYTEIEKIDPVTQDSINLVSQGYEPRFMRNGAEPDCFNYTPKRAKIDNKLIVDVGYGTDVVVKVISKSTERCIRYFYVNSGSTYTIYGIPQGIYYLKLAYGQQWMMSNEGGQCKGKFLRNAKYEIGDETLDYNFQYSGDGYSVPSFHLKLGVSYGLNNFKSDNISEQQFNN